MITVFHWQYRQGHEQCNRSGFFGFKADEAKRILDGEDPDFVFAEVAKVDTNNPDTAYRLTNHIDRSWWSNAGVTTQHSDAKPARSTSMGDLLVLGDGTRLIVASFGFTPVP